MIKAVFRDILKYLPSGVVPGIVGFVCIPIFTRLFSPQEYGNYSIAMATVMVMTVILGWLPMGIVRFYPVYEKKGNLHRFETSIFISNLISVLVLLVISSVTLLATKDLLSTQVFTLLFVGLGVLAANSQFNIFMGFLRSQRKAGLYSLFISMKSIGGAGIALMLIYVLKKDITYLLWGPMLGTCIILPLVWRHALKSISIFRFRIDPVLTKDIAKYSFPLVIGNLAAWVLSLSDRYILRFYRGALEVGIYSASYDIADKSVMLMVSLFTLVVSPLAFRIWEQEGEMESKAFSTSIARYFLMICLPSITGLMVLSKPIVQLFTAEEYHSGFVVMPLVVSGAILFGLQQHFQRGLLFYKKTSLIMYCVIISGSFNLLLNFLLIPGYGYIAAAFTTFLSYSLYFLAIILLSRRFYTWAFPFITLFRVIGASAIMGTAVYFLYTSLSGALLLNLFLAIFVGIMIYFGILFFFREFDFFLFYQEVSTYLKELCLRGGTDGTT